MNALRFSPRRFLSLLKKEAIEIFRDRSILFMGLVLPLLMLFIYGYGVSMDMEAVPAAVVLKERTPAALAFTRDLSANKQFAVRTVQGRPSRSAARKTRDRIYSRNSERLRTRPDFRPRTGSAHDLRGRQQFSRDLSQLCRRHLGADRRQNDSGGAHPFERAEPRSAVTIVPRTWFNDEANSRWYLVPGLLVIVSAVSASLMGSIVIAREWERGPLTSLFATPASSLEILLSKWTAYSFIAYCGFLLCLILAFLLFNEPLRGSLWVLLGTGFLYVGWAAALGLFVSAKTKSQFLATEAAVLASFMPTMMLSGFIFDLRSVPVWIEVVGRLLPPTYAVETFRICFLSGGQPVTLAVNALVIALWTAGLFAGALKVLGKSPLEAKHSQKKAAS